MCHEHGRYKMVNVASIKAVDFLAELTWLSHKYLLGIGENAELFMLEPDDTERRYRLDSNSNLVFD